MYESTNDNYCHVLAIKSAAPLENEICEKCRQSSSGQLIVTKIKITVILSQAPLGTPPEATVSVLFWLLYVMVVYSDNQSNITVNGIYTLLVYRIFKAFIC